MTRPTGCGPKLAKNTEKLGGTPNQRIKKREMDLSSRQTPLILTLTPKPHPPDTPNSPNFVVQIRYLAILGKNNQKKGFFRKITTSGNEPASNGIEPQPIPTRPTAQIFVSFKHIYCKIIICRWGERGDFEVTYHYPFCNLLICVGPKVRFYESSCFCALCGVLVGAEVL